MLRRLIPIMLLLVLALMLVAPAFAQDNSPAPVQTVEATINGTPVEATLVPVVTPAPVEQPSPLSWLSQISPWLGAIAIVALIIVGVLGRAFIIQLGSSVPVAFYEISRGAAVAGLDSLGQYVSTTATTIDDAGYAELRKLFDELKAEIEAKRQEQAELIQRYLNSPPANPSAN